MAAVVTASEAYNMLQESSCVILDTRPHKMFAKGHIRCSSRVVLSRNGRTLEQDEGPGPPVWHSGCWHDRHVLAVDWTPDGETRKRKADGRGSAAEESEVVRFLFKEGLARSIRVLSAKGAESAFSEFSSRFPFAITKSNRPTPVARYPSEVVQGFLYLGDWDHATAEGALQDLSISHIVTAHSSPLSLKSRFTQLHLQLEDEPKEDITRFFSVCTQFLNSARDQGGRVLVHCGAGASRSATLCAAFLMETRHWTSSKALKHLKNCRSKVAPNEGFLKALHDYDKCLGLSHLPLGDATAGASGKRASTSRVARENAAKDDKHPSHSGLQLEVIKDGVCVGKIVVEAGKEHVVGRGPACDTVLNHSSISKIHACIGWCPDNTVASITDLGSLHGTRVDGNMLKDKSFLSHGSTVNFAASTRSYIVRYLN